MHDLELARITHALKMWRHYLLGKRFILMSDHIGLRYLFNQPNLNARQARWLAVINEFDFRIRYIKGKENKVVDALSVLVQVNHLAAMSSYGRDLQDMILQACQQDVRYMEIVHRLQQSTGTCNGTYTSTSKSTGAQNVDYCLTTDRLVRFRDGIYVSDNNELKKVTLRDFHAKLYSGHPCYQKTFTAVKKFYYWPNLKKDVAEFVVKCFDF